MLRGDSAFSARVEQAVTEIEARTDAEVVVVASPRSGSYRDVALAMASLGAFVAMNLAFFSPFTFHPWALSLELVAVWGAAAWLASGTPVLRWMVSPARKTRQVREAAFAEFHREAVHATPQRVGVLIYVSFLEQQVEILPDVGLERLLPGGRWVAVRAKFGAHDLEGFIGGLQAMGELLAEAVPATAAGPGVELSDAPRIRT